MDPYTYQVKFKVLNKYDNRIYGGIYVDDTDKKYVICGCCGSVFRIDDVKIINKYDDWANLSEEIMGD